MRYDLAGISIILSGARPCDVFVLEIPSARLKRIFDSSRPLTTYVRRGEEREMKRRREPRRAAEGFLSKY